MCFNPDNAFQGYWDCLRNQIYRDHDNNKLLHKIKMFRQDLVFIPNLIKENREFYGHHLKGDIQNLIWHIKYTLENLITSNKDLTKYYNK